jgi:hypothetical protein
MNRTRILIAGLIAVHVVLHVVAFNAMTRCRLGGSLPDMPTWALFIVLGFSQGSLLALWIALGRGRAAWRILAATAVTVGYLWCFRDSDVRWLLFISGSMADMTALLSLARLSGLELIHGTDPPIPHRRPQFSLRDMFVWTTTVVVVLGILRTLPDAFWAANPAGFVLFAGAISSPIAAAAMWAVLGQRWLAARVFVLLLAVGAILGAFIAGSLASGEPPLLFAAAVPVAVAALLVASLLIVRLAGYRLTWRWRFGRDL